MALWAHRRMTGEGPGQGHEAANITNVHSILPSEFIIHERVSCLLHLSLLLWPNGTSFCITSFSDTQEYYLIMSVAVQVWVSRNRFRLRLMCRKLLERAVGNTSNRGVREVGLNQRRVWTAVWLQWSPQRVLGELCSWTGPSQLSGIAARRLSLCIPLILITGQKIDVGCPQRWVLLEQGSFLQFKTLAVSSSESTLQETWETQCHHHRGGRAA